MMTDVEDLEKFLRTPKDISHSSDEIKADILTLHFIGYLAKPIGINDVLYKKCAEAFDANRGKVEWESAAVLKALQGGM